MARLFPRAIPLLGHALTLACLLGIPLWIGVVGLRCDAADVFLARRLCVTSAYGAIYGWTVDVPVCALVVQRLEALPGLLILVPLRVDAHRAGRHVSGRALVSLVLAALTLVGSWSSRPQGDELPALAKFQGKAGAS